MTDFIRAWRDQEGKAPKAFVPLAFEPGEAFQFDWRDESMVVGCCSRTALRMWTS